MHNFFLSVENNHELDEEQQEDSLEENDNSDDVNSDSMDENDFGTLLLRPPKKKSVSPPRCATITSKRQIPFLNSVHGKNYTVYIFNKT